jgi:hypothetical protein
MLTDVTVLARSSPPTATSAAWVDELERLDETGE